jgi:hypothetical protein
VDQSVAEVGIYSIFREFSRQNRERKMSDQAGAAVSAVGVETAPEVTVARTSDVHGKEYNQFLVRHI